MVVGTTTRVDRLQFLEAEDIGFVTQDFGEEELLAEAPFGSSGCGIVEVLRLSAAVSQHVERHHRELVRCPFRWSPTTLERIGRWLGHSHRNLSV